MVLKMFETNFSFSLATYTAVVGLVYLIWRGLTVGSRANDFPPGPPTLPVIGNLHQLPKKNIHVQYRKWSQQYGPIFSLKLGQQTTVVLASGKVIRELVDQRGSVYGKQSRVYILRDLVAEFLAADRPQLWVRELFDDSRIIMRGYDDLWYFDPPSVNPWRTERKLYHSQLNITVAQKYLPYQELETLQMLTQLLHDPTNFVQHLGRMTTSMASSMAYGFRLPDASSPLAQKMMHNSHGFFHCVVESQVLDWYPSLKPFLRLVPRRLNPLARKAVKAYQEEQKVFKAAYDMGLKSPVPCFSQDIEVSKPDMQLLTDHAAMYIAGISFEGAADTTRYTMEGFIKAMAMFPDIQKKAHSELDDVVGPHEVPSRQHLKSLKYINQVTKETVRWMPTGINGAIPHATAKEDYYGKYRIPKGATIVLAVWSANHNEDDFNDPRDFQPERHNPDTSIFEASNSASPRERGQWSFGSGRRMCPGMHVAHNTLLLSIARLLWAFDIHPAKDESGNDIPIDRDAMVGGLAAAPAPFQCSITARSKERQDLIDKEWNALSKQKLDADGNYKSNMFE